MLFFDGGLGLMFLALWIFCVIDVITTPESQCRNLPKLAWIFVVIMLLDVGAISWLVAGRPRGRASADRLLGTDRVTRGERGTAAPAWPANAGVRGPNPDDDEEFLAGLRARAEEQRRRAGEARQPEVPDEPS